MPFIGREIGRTELGREALAASLRTELGGDAPAASLRTALERGALGASLMPSDGRWAGGPTGLMREALAAFSMPSAGREPGGPTWLAREVVVTRLILSTRATDRPTGLGREAVGGPIGLDCKAFATASRSMLSITRGT